MTVASVSPANVASPAALSSDVRNSAISSSAFASRAATPMMEGARGAMQRSSRPADPAWAIARAVFWMSVLAGAGLGAVAIAKATGLA